MFQITMSYPQSLVVPGTMATIPHQEAITALRGRPLTSESENEWQGQANQGLDMIELR